MWEKLDELFRYRNDLILVDEFGRSPLHIAAEWGLENIALDFLDNNANVNAQDNNKNTPLHCAAQNGKLKMCELLLSRGAKIDMENNDGKTAYDLATSQNVRDLFHLYIWR